MRRRFAGRTCRTRRTAGRGIVVSTSAGRKPIRTAPRRTCATSRMVAPRRFASCATGSPCSDQGCVRMAPPRCSAASTASPYSTAPHRRHRGANHRARRPCRRIDQARRTRAGDGQGGRVEVVTDGRPLRGGRSSRAGRRRYLPVAGARAARRTSGAPRTPPGHRR